MTNRNTETLPSVIDSVTGVGH